MQMFQLIKGSCADEAVGYCPKACFRGCGKGHPLMEGAPESMGLPELLGQEGQAFKGLDQRPYTVFPPSPRLVPGSGDGGLAALSGSTGFSRGAGTSPPSFLPHITALPPPQHPSGPCQHGPCLFSCCPACLLPGCSGHLPGLATVPDTKANQDQVLLGPHCNHPGLPLLKVSRKE